MRELIPYLINGVSVGGQYALIAIGYTLVYGILRLINFAHGDVFMVAGLVMVYATASMPIYLAIPLALIATVILGFTIERVAYKPLRTAPRMSLMISAIGVSYLIQNLAFYLTGGVPQPVNNPIPWISDTVAVFGASTKRVTLITPFLTIALVIVLVLSASMSTLSSLALTSSSTLALDVILPVMNKKKKQETSEKKSVFIMRLLIVFFVALSAVIAILKDTVWADSVFIAQMMGVSWGALAGAFLAPFLYGLYSKRISKPAVATCFVFGTGLEIVQLLISMKLIAVNGGFLGFIFKNSLYSGVFAMLAGLVIVPLVSAFTQKWVPKESDEIFGCYMEKIVMGIPMTPSHPYMLVFFCWAFAIKGNNVFAIIHIFYTFPPSPLHKFCF